VLLGHIEAGRVAGLDWFTPERASFSCDPRNLQPSARSILAVGVAYRLPDAGKPDDGVPRGRISRYARGADYHDLLKSRMRALHARIEDEVGRPVEARFLVDTARIVDRAVAARAGLGWYGKHSCLIVPGHGSWGAARRAGAGSGAGAGRAAGTRLRPLHDLPG
jgi:epoxyqueuosine reductase